MKARTIARLGCIALFAGFASHGARLSAATVALWTFETNPPADVTNSAVIGGVSADVGGPGIGGGTASGTHASANTDWTTPAGNGSANSLSANEWSAGDYFQFSVDTTGKLATHFQFDQTRSATGPDDFKVQVDYGDGNYVDVGSPYVVTQNTWSSGAPIGSKYGPFLLGPEASNNLAFSIRIVALEAGSATGGTGRVDNVELFNIPEPATRGLGLVAIVGLTAARRRR